MLLWLACLACINLWGLHSTTPVCAFSRCTSKWSHHACKPWVAQASSSPCPWRCEPPHSGRTWQQHLTPASSLWLLPRSPGHPAWWVCSLVATLVASVASSRAEMTIPAGWLRNGKACLSMWACCYAVCCPWGRGGVFGWNGINYRDFHWHTVCAYLPFGHDWTKTSTHGKADFSSDLSSVWFWCPVPSVWVTMSPNVLKQ